MPLADLGALRYGLSAVLVCRLIVTFVFAGIGLGFGSDQGDRFAPPPFDVALFAPEGLDQVNVISGILAAPSPVAPVSKLESVVLQLNSERLRGTDVSKRIESVDLIGVLAADVVLSTDQEGVVALVEELAGLIPWIDRFSGDYLLADTDHGSDRWKVKVKAGPVPAVILRAHW